MKRDGRRFVILPFFLLFAACGAAREQANGPSSASVGQAARPSDSRGDALSSALGRTRDDGTRPTDVATGAVHTCARLTDGTVRCWGRNSAGQLGDGTKAPASRPVVVRGVGNVTSVTAGAAFTCALLSDATVSCWGANDVGEVGNGATSPSSPPTAVKGVVGASAIATGGGHACALLRDGRVECWGSNSSGELGNGTTTDDSPTPVMASGVHDAIAVTAGVFHTCALLRGGDVTCWGGNEDGQLGNGQTANSPIPVAVQTSGATAIAAGDEHTCALLSDGSVRCWGANSHNQLGQAKSPATEEPSPTPTPVAGISGGVHAIAAGGTHTCATLRDGSVTCWGDNVNYAFKYRGGEAHVPTLVANVSGTVALAAGSGHACAIIGENQVSCWGFNRFGQLGNGTTVDSVQPTPVAW